ncbi:MAG: LD-carboxypeptidase [Bacteroidetes bacterium SW_11_45_7]|nr:MAG: LD-carboxypeptidase [Bacteroidetes bacterium SW_11_45_7]
MPIHPPPLQPRDKVGIVSTARKITHEEIKPAFDILKRRDLVPVCGDTIGQEHNQYAGDDDTRAADFQSMLDDPSIRAIHCARGGYGTVRIIDQLDFSSLPEKPKWITGFSDVTVLLSHLYQHHNIITLHATMPLKFPNNTPASLQSLYDAWFGKQLHYDIEYHPFDQTGEAKAPLVGGNLSVLYSLLGSPSDIDTDGAILFLEELDEYLYHIDRMMMNLRRNGKLRNLAGLIIGAMTDMNDNQLPYGKTAEEIVHEHVHDADYPVLFGFAAGHIPDNRALKMGANISLKVSESKGEVRFHE